MGVLFKANLHILATPKLLTLKLVVTSITVSRENPLMPLMGLTQKTRGTKPYCQVFPQGKNSHAQ